MSKLTPLTRLRVEPLFKSLYSPFPGMSSEKESEKDGEGNDGRILRELWPHSRWTLLGMVVLSRLVFPVVGVYGRSHMTMYMGSEWIVDSGIEYYVIIVYMYSLPTALSKPPTLTFFSATLPLPSYALAIMCLVNLPR